MIKKRACVVSSYTYIKTHINYGALFQYYALENFMEECGCDTFWLRYVIKEKKDFLSRIKKVIKTIVNFRRIRCERRILESFHKFVNNKLHTSEMEYHNIVEIKNNMPKADFYVTGSDQVWGGCEEINYLTFVPEEKKRVAYAASFGKSQISDEQKRIITSWVKRINYVSVRELSGVQICASMGVEAVHVSDPTFLIETDKYPCIEPIISNYTFAYMLNLDIDQAKELAIFCRSSLNTDERFICTAGVSEMDRVLDDSELAYLTPEEWIGMYRNANTIITNTFHGTVFALLFHKQFVVFYQKGMGEKQNERIHSLLNMFSLSDRYCDNFEKAQKIISAEINWDQFDEKREEISCISKGFLKNAIGI